MVWSLLDNRERLSLIATLWVIILSAIAAAAMVWAVFPFLQILTDPALIHSQPALSWAYEKFAFQSDYHFTLVVGLLSMSVILISSLMQIARVVIVSRFTLMRTHSLAIALVRGYLNQNYEFFLKTHSSNTGARILQETSQAVQQFLRPAAQVISSVLTIGFVFALLMWLEPVVTIYVGIGLAGVYLGIFAVSGPKLKRLGEERRVSNVLRFRALGEVFSGARDIKLSGKEHFFSRRFDEASKKMVRAMVKTQVLASVPPYALQGLVFASVVLACLLLLEPDAQAGQGFADILPILGVIALAAQRLLPEFSKGYKSLGLMQSGVAALESVATHFKLVSEAPEMEASNGPPYRLRQKLEIKNVDHAYAGADKLSLAAVNIEIFAGQRIGIVGGSGAGKTTVCNLLLGLLFQQSGEFKVDDVLITPANIARWQRSVAYVPQQIFLMDASIAENVAFGIQKNQIDYERVREVIRLAQLEEFVLDELPAGLDEKIGEYGVRLSGGQRQRLGLARAFYNDADLIVLDEATSALDNHTERQLVKALDSISGHKTIVMVAHRLSTVEKCDSLFVMDSGKIVGVGTFNELTKENAVFQQMLLDQPDNSM